LQAVNTEIPIFKFVTFLYHVLKMLADILIKSKWCVVVRPADLVDLKISSYRLSIASGLLTRILYTEISVFTACNVYCLYTFLHVFRPKVDTRGSKHVALINTTT
jgi:hypothetical protein